MFIFNDPNFTHKLPVSPERLINNFSVSVKRNKLRAVIVDGFSTTLAISFAACKCNRALNVSADMENRVSLLAG